MIVIKGLRSKAFRSSIVPVGSYTVPGSCNMARFLQHAVVRMGPAPRSAGITSFPGSGRRWRQENFSCARVLRQPKVVEAGAPAYTKQEPN